jgi:hypothetical protein
MTLAIASSLVASLKLTLIGELACQSQQYDRYEKGYGRDDSVRGTTLPAPDN